MNTEDKHVDGKGLKGVLMLILSRIELAVDALANRVAAVETGKLSTSGGTVNGDICIDLGNSLGSGHIYGKTYDGARGEADFADCGSLTVGVRSTTGTIDTGWGSCLQFNPATAI